jgi:hypothetical protein
VDSNGAAPAVPPECLLKAGNLVQAGEATDTERTAESHSGGSAMRSSEDHTGPVDGRLCCENQLASLQVFLATPGGD